MAKIQYFLLCEDVQPFEQNGKSVHAVINPMVVLDVPYIPTAYTLFFSVAVTEVDVDNQPSIKIEIVNEKTNEVAFSLENEIIIPDEIKIGINEDKQPFFQLAGPLKNIILKDVGKYEARFYLNNVLLGTTELKVTHNE